MFLCFHRSTGKYQAPYWWRIQWFRADGSTFGVSPRFIVRFLTPYCSKEGRSGETMAPFLSSNGTSLSCTTWIGTDSAGFVSYPLANKLNIVLSSILLLSPPSNLTHSQNSLVTPCILVCPELRSAGEDLLSSKGSCFGYHLKKDLVKSYVVRNDN